MAEGGGLLNRCTVSSRTVGSNPIPSANLFAPRYRVASAAGATAMIRRFARACVCLLLACPMALRSTGAAASGDAPVTAADGLAIRSVITAQLDAFRQDDAGRAFGIASPHIEARYGDAATFLAMVKAAYPAVYRAHDVSFGPLARQNGALAQQVGLVGPDGAGAVALYTMEREPNGSWRIDGCVLTAGEGEGA